VLEDPAGVSPPLRDLPTYVDVLRSWHRSGSLRGVTAVNPFEERWRPAFAIVEPGARVSSAARLRDSVVLSGGVVESGGDVVRSVVGPAGVVRRRERAVDRLVTGAPDEGRAPGRRP
jgi:hypothetical protein